MNGAIKICVLTLLMILSSCTLTSKSSGVQGVGGQRSGLPGEPGGNPDGQGVAPKNNANGIAGLIKTYLSNIPNPNCPQELKVDAEKGLSYYVDCKGTVTANVTLSYDSEQRFALYNGAIFINEKERTEFPFMIVRTYCTDPSEEDNFVLFTNTSGDSFTATADEAMVLAKNPAIWPDPQSEPQIFPIVPIPNITGYMSSAETSSGDPLFSLKLSLLPTPVGSLMMQATGNYSLLAGVPTTGVASCLMSAPTQGGR